MRSFVTAAAEHSGLVHEDVFAFKLAADELCTNIIQYGYEEGEPGFLSLFFDVEENHARLTIRDDGVHFAPDAAPTPDVDLACEDRDSGGLGLFFVRELMDTVSYGSDAHGNVLVLEKTVGSKEKK
jgi:anti-sigma regulatory factor (Ser/Thr protein kinase)